VADQARAGRWAGGSEVIPGRLGEVRAARMIKILGATLVALVIGLLTGPRFIRLLQKRGIGQNIREAGPERHSIKQGTPPWRCD